VNPNNASKGRRDGREGKVAKPNVGILDYMISNKQANKEAKIYRDQYRQGQSERNKRK
jgi:hypothetical protein